MGSKRISLNDRVRVQLTERGLAHLVNSDRELGDIYRKKGLPIPWGDTPLGVDQKTMTWTTEMWNVINMLGPITAMHLPPPALWIEELDD